MEKVKSSGLISSKPQIKACSLVATTGSTDCNIISKSGPSEAEGGTHRQLSVTTVGDPGSTASSVKTA